MLFQQIHVKEIQSINKVLEELHLVSGSRAFISFCIVKNCKNSQELGSWFHLVRLIGCRLHQQSRGTTVLWEITAKLGCQFSSNILCVTDQSRSFKKVADVSKTFDWKASYTVSHRQMQQRELGNFLKEKIVQNQIKKKKKNEIMLIMHSNCASQY